MKRLKKAITLLMTALIVLSFAACSNGNGTEGGTNTSNELSDFSITISGKTYTLPTDLDEFKNDGWEYGSSLESKDIVAGYFDAFDATKDGKEITLTVYNAGKSIKKLEDCPVGSVRCDFSSTNDMTLKLPKKLSVTKNTTIEDVTRKFGECQSISTYENESLYTYTIDSKAFYEFRFNAEGKLTLVWIQNEIEEEDDTIIEENDLSYLDDYVAPDALTDNYADYIFRLDGKLYQFPAPVSEFIDDGWTIKYDPKPINGGNTGSFIMKKNGYELAFEAKNFATGPVEPKDAMMIGVSLYSESLDDLDFELSGGITFGMSFSDFESKPFFNQFTSGSDIFGDIQYSYFEPSNRTYITFKDDQIVDVSITKNKLNQ